jgi:hypothetical protein
MNKEVDYDEIYNGLPSTVAFGPWTISRGLNLAACGRLDRTLMMMSLNAVGLLRTALLEGMQMLAGVLEDDKK